MKYATIILIVAICMASSVMAIEECTSPINYNEVPCFTLLAISSSISCAPINMTVYNNTDSIYNMSMLETSNPSLCNATFNISTPGTYTLLYSNGNFTDTGSIIVEGSGMEWLVYLAAALSIALFIIAYLSKDPNLLTLCGMMFLITGIILIAVGFGSIQNVWTQSVGMIVFGIGAIFLVVPNLDWIEQMMR